MRTYYKINITQKMAICLMLLLWHPLLKASDDISTRYINLQGLDKITGRVFNLISPVGQQIKFGSLKIIPHACYASPEEDLPNAKGFLEIWEVPSAGETTRIFSSWMFSASPALSALDHPVYDVWVVKCTDTVNDIKNDTPK